MQGKLQRERDIIDAALRRPWHQQRLDPALEARFHNKTKKADKKRAIISLLIVVVVETVLLSLDQSANVLAEAIKLKIFINFPLVAIAIIMIAIEAPRQIKICARVIAIASVIFTTVVIGMSVPSSFADRYFMCAGLFGFAVNLVFAASLFEAVLQSAVNIILYAGVPLSGLFGQSSSTDIVLALSAMMMMTLRFVRQRERADKDAFLLHVRDQLQTVEMSELIDELTASSLTDALTGVANRRGFELKLANTMRASNASGQQFSLLMIDIDNFKLFNDTGGHSAGDACLQEVAQTIVASVDRFADAVSRYGGEEFIVILPSVQNGSNDARVVAENVRRSVEERAITHPGIPGGVVTVSIGVATMLPWVKGAGPATVLEAADVALYRAKRSGRNRVNVSAQLRSHAAA